MMLARANGQKARSLGPGDQLLLLLSLQLIIMCLVSPSFPHNPRPVEETNQSSIHQYSGRVTHVVAHTSHLCLRSLFRAPSLFVFFPFSCETLSLLHFRVLRLSLSLVHWLEHRPRRTSARRLRNPDSENIGLTHTCFRELVFLSHHHISSISSCPPPSSQAARPKPCRKMSWKPSEKLVSTISHYASFPPTGVSLRQMVQFGEKPSTGRRSRYLTF